MARKNIHSDYRSVFGTAAGKRVLGDLMQELCYGEKLYAKDDAGRIANITRHDVAIFIKDRIETKEANDE